METILIIAVVLFSIIIHEVAHGYAALSMGDKTALYAGRLTLNPIQHIDLFGTVILPLLLFFSTGFVFGWAKPVPYNPYNLSNQRWGDAIVAVAGPAVNILIATVFSILLHLGISTFANATEIFEIIILFNVILAVFNLLPIPPLDGSKILFSLLPYNKQHIKHSLERYGFLILILVLFLFYGPISVLIDYVYKLFLP